MQRVVGMIMAAGYGRRMAPLGPKPFLPIRGRSFIDTIIDRFHACGIEDIRIVTNPVLEIKMRQVLGDQVRLVVNEQPERGMLSSVQCGIASIIDQAAACLMTPVDLPLVDEHTYLSLLYAHRKNPDCIIKPVYKKQGGHPIVIPASLFKGILTADSGGTLRDVLRHYDALQRCVVVNDPGIHINLNTPEVYRQFCESDVHPFSGERE